MIYNAKYDRWVSKDGLVYRYDKKIDKLVLCKIKPHYGYERVYTKIGCKFVHRVVYETFVGEIPSGMEIDHINTNRDDNRVENLLLTTHKGNCNNKLTLINKRTSYSDFGIKFRKHFGLSRYDSVDLYYKEYRWYKRHNNVCRWEVEDKCKS